MAQAPQQPQQLAAGPLTVLHKLHSAGPKLPRPQGDRQTSPTSQAGTRSSHPYTRSPGTRVTRVNPEGCNLRKEGAYSKPLRSVRVQRRVENRTNELGDERRQARRRRRSRGRKQTEGRSYPLSDRCPLDSSPVASSGQSPPNLYTPLSGHFLAHPLSDRCPP